MLLGMWLIDTFPVGPLKSLQQIAEEQIVPLFRHVGIVGFAAISLSAGLGEELLFRWFLQRGLMDWVGPPIGLPLGLVVASIAFGLCHWLNMTYALLTFCIGLYLGGLFIATGGVVVPLVAHALYDFVALVYLSRRFNVNNIIDHSV